MVALLAWMQLIVSLAFAAALIWGYATYHSSLGQFVRSLAASIVAVSNVVARSAETLEARGELLNQSAQMLAETRRLINQLLVIAETQSKLAPKHAEGLQSAAAITGKLGGVLLTAGDRMASISVPSGVRFDGYKPIVTMTNPMAEQAKEARTVAQDIKNVSETMASVAAVVGRDGRNLGAGVIATGNQALKVIGEAEKTLARINAQDLPKAVSEMKATSKNLVTVSTQIDMIGQGGTVLLSAGLILAVWCFLNSLGMLTLVIARKPTTTQLTTGQSSGGTYRPLVVAQGRSPVVDMVAS